MPAFSMRRLNPTKEFASRQDTILDALPQAIMICDLDSFVITYANPASVALLRKLTHELSIDPDNIVGTCIDVFHKNPAHQRRLLSDPANLPHSTRIRLGSEYLHLQISPWNGASGKRNAILSWNIVTAQVREEHKTQRLMQMIENMPINVMTCDPESFVIDFVNETSRKTLKTIEEHLPVKADAVLGSTIDVFHKRPTHQREILSDPSRLPINANIKVGPETLNLKVSAIYGADGGYLGPMVTWAVITDRVKLADSVTTAVSGMVETSSAMTDSAGHMAGIAERAQSMAASVSAATEEMASTISEIAQQVTAASDMSQSTQQRAGIADETVKRLDGAAADIGGITEVIQGIAAQTNLLALNATIEAARAGEAGKGFAVVAQEVKALATQTAKATDQIKERITGIQGMTGETVEAIAAILNDVGTLSATSAQIAAAIEEQSAAVREITANMAGVSDAARETGEAASAVRDVSSNLDAQSSRLSGDVNLFLSDRE